METTCDICGGPVAIVKCKYICTVCGTINKSCADLDHAACTPPSPAPVA